MIQPHLYCAYMYAVITFPYLGQVVDARFATQPLSMVQASELEAEFECFYPGAILHGWIINEMFLFDDQFPDSFTRTPPSTDSPVARLIIPATPQYNNTVVQCEAVVQEGGVFVRIESNNATFTVQNIESLELKVMDYNITVSWDNPFTTNLTFCVDAVSVVSSETLASVCVKGTQYTFTSLDTDLCEEVSFTVTPTDGERNGTNTSSQSVLGFVQEKRDILFVQCPETNASKQAQCVLILLSPLICEIELTFITNDAIDLPSINYTLWISGDGNTAYELSSVIVANRHYLVNITVNTFSDRRLLPNMAVSTHDIIKVSMSVLDDGALNTSCTFVANTTARGYLVVISATSECKSHEDTIFSAQYNTAGTGDIIKGVGCGQYIINFFDLESDGLPVHSRTDSTLIGSAFSTEVNISTGFWNQYPVDSLEEAAAVGNNDSACVRCSSHMDCLVLLYDCTTPDLLVTLFVPATEERCVSAQNKNYSVAFYGIDNSNKLLINNFPGKVAGITFNLQTPTPNPTALRLITALSAVAIAIGVAIMALFGLLFLYQKKKKSKPEFYDKSSIHSPGSPVISGSSNEYEQVFSDKSSTHSARSPVMSGSSSEYEQELNVAYAVPGNIRIGTSQKESVNVIVNGTHNRYSEVPGRQYQTKSNIGMVHESAYAVPDGGLVGTSERDPTDANTYAEIAGHQHHMQMYTHVVIQTDQTLPGDRRNVREVEYTEIDRDKLVTQVSLSVPNEISSPIPDSTAPLDTSTLHSLLSPAANKWFEIGLAMGFSEDTLQGEIYHDNSIDWLRLEEVCMLYCRYKPSWEEVVRVLWKVEEWEIADKICRQEKLEIECPFQQNTQPPPALPLRHTASKKQH